MKKRREKSDRQAPDALKAIMRFVFSFVFIILVPVTCFGNPAERELAADGFLQPYVATLKSELSDEDLNRIRISSDEDLILLHHGLGTSIRNRWIHGGRDPELVKFFRERGIRHPDEMSMIIIYSLWSRLNRDLAPDERTRIETMRQSVVRKRDTYAKLETECTSLLSNSTADFMRCTKTYGWPSENRENMNPFYKLRIANDGSIKEIVFFAGASEGLKNCVGNLIYKYKFSSFTDDQVVTLYPSSFPHCRAANRDELH